MSEPTAERAARQALQGQPRGRKSLDRDLRKLRPSEEALQAEIERLREVIAELSSDPLGLRLKKGRW